MQSAETVLDVRRERNHDHDIVTGEPGDRKRSRRVVCPSHDYVEGALRGRPFPCFKRFGLAGCQT